MKRKNIPTANAHEEKRINLKAPLGEGIANQGNVVFLLLHWIRTSTSV